MVMATSTMLALAATAASAGASAYNTSRVAKKQDNIAADGIRTQAENQRKVSARLNQTIDQTAKSTGEASRTAANASYMDNLQRKLAQGTQGLRARGLSDTYDEAAGQAAGQAGDYATTIAGLLSRIDAGPAQRQAENNLLGDFSMDANRIGGDIQGDQFLNGIRMKAVRRNPYVDLLAGGLKAYGSSGGGYDSSGINPSYTPVAGGGRADYGSWSGQVRTA